MQSLLHNDLKEIKYISEENSKTGLFWRRFHTPPMGHGGPDTWTCLETALEYGVGEQLSSEHNLGQMKYSSLFFSWLEEKAEITYLCNIWLIAAYRWSTFLLRVINYTFA